MERYQASQRERVNKAIAKYKRMKVDREDIVDRTRDQEDEIKVQYLFSGEDCTVVPC